MSEFFIDNVVGMPFILFGFIHYMSWFLTILAIVLIIVYRDKIKTINIDTKRNITLVMIGLLFLNMMIYYLSRAYYGIYDWRVHLPLHLCFISGFMFMYAHLTNNVKLCRLTFVLSFLGPIPAILLPALKSGFDAFTFYQFVISHHVFIIFSVFLYYLNDIKLTLKDVINTFIFANIVYFTMSIFNKIFDTNYILSNSFPNHVLKTFPFLENMNNPMLLFEGMAIIMLFGIYYFFVRENKFSNK